MAAGSAAATGCQVQVGAYSTRARAERARRLVKRSAQGLLDGLPREVVKADLGEGRDIVYRLRAGPSRGRAAARKLCFELRIRNVACFVVPPSKAPGQGYSDRGSGRMDRRPYTKGE